MSAQKLHVICHEERAVGRQEEILDKAYSGLGFRVASSFGFATLRL